jgi:hypothetical protein
MCTPVTRLGGVHKGRFRKSLEEAPVCLNRMFHIGVVRKSNHLGAICLPSRASWGIVGPARCRGPHMRLPRFRCLHLDSAHVGHVFLSRLQVLGFSRFSVLCCCCRVFLLLSLFWFFFFVVILPHHGTCFLCRVGWVMCVEWWVTVRCERIGELMTQAAAASSSPPTFLPIHVCVTQ